MARQESDREDLLREATALVDRAEIKLPELAESTVFGFRRDGCLSIYFQPDEVYHFNSENELRRAHIGGELIKAENGRLVGLNRQRKDREVALVRREFSSQQQAQFLQRLEQVLNLLSVGITGVDVKVISEIGVGADVINKFCEFSATRGNHIVIADRAHAE